MNCTDNYFVDVTTEKIFFPDNKTFVDCVPKKNAAEIISDYNKIRTETISNDTIKKVCRR